MGMKHFLVGALLALASVQPIPAFADSTTHQLVRTDGSYPVKPLEIVQPVFDQYRQEVPLNHLDLPPEEMPQTGEEMKALLDGKSRWLN